MTRILEQPWAGLARRATDGAVLHVHYARRNFDISAIGLDLTPFSSDEAIKGALAGFLNVPDDWLDDYVIDRHANGNLTIRPQGAFG